MKIEFEGFGNSRIVGGMREKLDNGTFAGLRSPQTRPPLDKATTQKLQASIGECMCVVGLK